MNFALGLNCNNWSARIIREQISAKIRKKCFDLCDWRKCLWRENVYRINVIIMAGKQASMVRILDGSSEMSVHVGGKSLLIYQYKAFD